MKALALADTYLKDRPAQRDLCDYIVLAKKGTEINVKFHHLDNHSNHHYFTLDKDYDGDSRWWGYAPDWRIEGTEPNNNPIEAQPQNTPPEPPQQRTINTYRIPGITAPVSDKQPVYEGSNFTWGEATMYGDRIPVHPGITGNIIRLAKYMDLVRRDLGGNPIKVTSWYRDPVTNDRVGGAISSQHLHGLAVDFYLPSMDLRETFRRLKRFRGGTLSLAIGNGFVHLDLRPGAPARWRYPGGPVEDLW
jgi:hypothetical protein